MLGVSPSANTGCVKKRAQRFGLCQCFGRQLVLTELGDRTVRRAFSRVFFITLAHSQIFSYKPNGLYCLLHHMNHRIFFAPWISCPGALRPLPTPGGKRAAAVVCALLRSPSLRCDEDGTIIVIWFFDKALPWSPIAPHGDMAKSHEIADKGPF